MVGVSKIGACGSCWGSHSNKAIDNKLLEFTEQITKSLLLSEDAGKLADAGKAIMSSFDVRNISPRQMTDMSSQLFDAEVINFEDHLGLSFQPELNQLQYKAVTGLEPEPDKPRDFIQLWQDKLDEQLQQGVGEDFLGKSKHILALLRNLDALA